MVLGVLTDVELVVLDVLSDVELVGLDVLGDLAGRARCGGLTTWRTLWVRQTVVWLAGLAVEVCCCRR